MTEPTREYTLVTSPRDGIVPVIVDATGLRDLVDQLDRTAPVAVDAERAQSYRYSARAYLIQLRQVGCGTHLIDPVALAGRQPLADLHELGDALVDSEWVLHAASQDLPCLAEVGLVPHHLFDTEMAGRLLNLPKVSLSPMLSQFLGIELAKEHSMDDWSRRPLLENSLAYAALDVDYLIELRDAVAQALDQQGKLSWAEQEFEDTLTRFAVPPVQDAEHWRGMKGMTHVRHPRQLAVAHSLWQVRDELAQRLDINPGRILSDTQLTDAVLVLAALAPGQVMATLPTIDGFGGNYAKRHRSLWASAIEDALQMRACQLPKAHPSSETPPPRFWNQLKQTAARRWEVARPAVITIAKEHEVPVENLMTVATLATLLWPDDLDMTEAGLRRAMTKAQVRSWQQDLTAPTLASVLQDQ